MQPASTGTNLKDPAKRPARYGPVMTNDSDHTRVDAERTSGVGPRPGPGRRPGPPGPANAHAPRVWSMTDSAPSTREVSRPRDLPLPSSCRGPRYTVTHAEPRPLRRPRPPIRAADRDSDPSRKLDRKRYLTHSTARETQPTPHLSLPGPPGGACAVLHSLAGRRLGLDDRR